MQIIIPLLIASVLGGGVFTASQNSLPGDLFFPVKTFAEDARLVLAKDGEAKAFLHIELAENRLEEISDLLERRSADVDGLKIAMRRLEDHSAKANSFLEAETSKGGDVAGLANEMSLAIRANEMALKFEEDKLKAREDSISLAILQAGSKNDSPGMDRLLSERRGVAELRDVFEAEFKSLDENVFSRVDAAHDIKEAIAKRQRLVSEAELRGVVIPSDKIAEIENRIGMANNAFLDGRFEEAEDHAHFARDVIRFLDDTIVDPNPNKGSGNSEDNSGDSSGRSSSQNSGPGSINSGRETEVRGEFELRGRENEAGEDIRGNADEFELRGRNNEVESPGDQPRREDRGQETEIRSSGVSSSETEIRGRTAEGEASRGEGSLLSESRHSRGSDDSGRDGSDD